MLIAQDELDKLAKDLIDRNAWTIRVSTVLNEEVATTRAVTCMVSIASLMSIKFPKYIVEIRKYDLVRRAYQDGDVVSEKENPNLKDILPEASDSDCERWSMMTS